MRAGTENVHAIAGLAKAMELSYLNMEKDKIYISEIKKYMIDQLSKNIKDIKFNANCIDFENSLFKILSVSFPKISESEMLLLKKWSFLPSIFPMADLLGERINFKGRRML